MTPDQRLDQIEPVMADVLQKVDRLIEGQGKLVDLVVDTRAELEDVKTTVTRIDSTVNGHTDSIEGLKLTVGRNTDSIEELKTTVTRIDGTVDELKVTVNGNTEAIEELKIIVQGNTEAIEGVKTTVIRIDDTVKGNTDSIEELKTTVNRLDGSVEELKTKFSELGETVNTVKINGESTARALANLTVTSQKQFDELKAGQELILQILRDKLP